MKREKTCTGIERVRVDTWDDLDTPSWNYADRNTTALGCRESYSMTDALLNHRKSKNEKHRGRSSSRLALQMVLYNGKLTISKQWIVSIHSCFYFPPAWPQSVAQAIPVLLPPLPPNKFYFMFIEDRSCLRNLSVIVFIYFFWFCKAMATSFPSEL